MNQALRPGTAQVGQANADPAEGRIARGSAVTLPVMRPRLPQADSLRSYLDSIDDRRWYTNHGALVRALEGRLADHHGDGRPARTVSASSATAALTAALLALDLPPRQRIAVPAWTFCATAHAVVMAGHVPVLLDVDLNCWALTPATVRAALASGAAPIDAVVAVAPFGAPVEAEAWQAFRADTGTPVVVDAAAGFDSWRACDIPAVISLHATKVLGAGEGGYVVTTDTAYAERLGPILNFGIRGDAVARGCGFNGKMSEYAAAVALAALDDWAQDRLAWCAAAALYRPLTGTAWPVVQPGFGRDWIGSVLMVRFPGRDAAAIARALAASGIETRAWWPLPLSRHPAFAACPRHGGSHAARLGRECLGLPLFRDITDAQVRTVVAAVQSLREAPTTACPPDRVIPAASQGRTRERT